MRYRRGHRRLRLKAGGAGVALAVVGALGAPLPAALASAPPPATAPCLDSWTMYQHDLSHSGAPSCTGISTTTAPTLAPRWFFQTPGAVTATPVVLPDGTVLAGDSSGLFQALRVPAGASSPTPLWSFDVTKGSGTATCPADHHSASFGEITSTAAVAPVPGKGTVAFVGGGGTLYALVVTPAPGSTYRPGDCLWSRDTDPLHPTGPMEIESSPAVVPRGNGTPEVVVGSDANESTQGVASPGMQAFSASDGTLLWKYVPETDTVVDTLALPAGTEGCSDVWTSPAVDPTAGGGHGLVAFATGNCPTNSRLEAMVALDAATGQRLWRYTEPTSAYTDPSYPSGGDTDFGSSPALTDVNGVPAVVEASKSGFAYAVNEQTGAPLWKVQAAQPGELGGGPGAVGGFIGSGALGRAGGTPAYFGATAIPAPFGGNGPTDPDTTAICLADPSAGCLLRSAALHAVDTATGQVLWQQPIALPTYSAVTYSGGVVFAPATTGFSIDAYDAGTGVPLWSFPLGNAVASAASIVGTSLYVGTAIDEGSPTPGATGIWCFGVAGS